MASDGEPRRSIDGGDIGSSLQRAVSFPNFLRTFWYHHHAEEALSNSSLGSKTNSVSHIPPCEAVKEGEILILPLPTPSTAITGTPGSNWLREQPNSDIENISSLPRRDTWAGFGAAAQISSADNASTAVPPADSSSKTVEHLLMSVVGPASPAQSSSISTAVQSTISSVPTVPQMAPSHQPGSLLAAIFHHELAPRNHSATSSVSVGLATDEHHQPEKTGLFGLPSRVKVTGRELNMMSPISF